MPAAKNDAPRKKTSKKRAAKPETTDVLVVAVLDRSGSMGACRDAAIEGWNTYLSELQADEGGETFLTILAFDHLREVWADSLPVAKVEPLTHETYRPRGSTALYDSIAHAVALADEALEGREGTKVLIVTVTDGIENASVEYPTGEVGRLRLKALVEEREAQGNFTFVYLSSDISVPVAQAASALGIPAANAAATSPSLASSKASYSALAATTSGLRSSSARSSANAFADAGVGTDYTDEALKKGER